MQATRAMPAVGAQACPPALAAVPASRRPAAAACRQPASARPSRRLVLASAEGATTAAAASTIKIPTLLNTIPHDRDTRKWFYADLVDGVQRALAAGELKLIARSTFPELNTEFDVYRVGTLLELVREVATVMAGDSRSVKVCVQQPLGQGVFAGMPLSLNGVMRIMGGMGWGPAGDRITTGNIGAGEVEGADAFVIIAPQNIVGHSILPFLQEMTDAASAAGKPVVLINPKLTDIQSAGGVMSVRGRQDRLDYAATYKSAYHFRLLYKGVTMYPIMGAMRHTWGGPWEVLRRVQKGPGEEEYVCIGSWDKEPTPPQITEAFRAAWAAQQAAQQAG